MVLYLLKATVPGGAAADLFAAPVIVAGYTTKDGTAVAPHTAIRHKKIEQAAPAQASLFDAASAAPKPAAKPPEPKVQPGLFDATPTAPKEDHAAVAARAAALTAPKEIPSDPPAKAAPPAAASPPTEGQGSDSPHPTPASPTKPTYPWGVPAGTKASERVRLNAAAVALLEAKTDAEMTDADKAVLAQYTGNGGCGQSLNEFYTEPAIASAMWDMLRAAGFKGGTVLEPSCGTGVFMHTRPDDAVVTGVDIDAVSSRIASILHGGDIRMSSLERFATQDGALFDAVIGNAPFGKRGALLRQDPGKKDLGQAEQYFVDTGLDKLRDGGLMAMIVPTNIMRGKNFRSFRERVLRKAEFLGAHRLPNTAFEAAHTDVTTDILIFRKRPQDVAGALSTVTQDQLKALGVWDDEFLSGRYFDGRGASNVYGTEGTVMRAHGPIYAVLGGMDGVAAELSRWRPEDVAPGPDVPRILAELGDDADAKKRALDAAQKPAYQAAKVGDVRVVDGVRYILQGDPPRWHRMGADVPAVVQAALKVAEGLDDLIEGRAKDRGLARISIAEALDEFIAAHGAPGSNKELAAWIASPVLERVPDASPGDHANMVEGARKRVARLLGAVNKDGTYSDVITGRGEGEAGTASVDSVAARLAIETGSFTAETLAAQSGRTADEVLDHLHATPGYAVEPDGRTWTTMDAYLSGDLWPKLDAARAAAAHEGISAAYKAKYEAQAAALEATIAPACLEDVEITMASGFITPDDLSAYFAAKHAENEDSRYRYGYQPTPISVEYDDGVYLVHGTSGGDAKLLDKYLNRTGVRKDDRPALDRMNESFAEWVRTGPRRDEIEDRYNRNYKGFRQREDSDAPMAIPGLNPLIDVNAYHYSGLRWAIGAGKGIIADDVGLGKTGRALMLARLAKAEGRAKKPTIVVPKSVLANWVDETQFWFPGSRVLVIGENYKQNEDGSFQRDADGKLIGKEDTAPQRREKYHQLSQNNYDFVLVSAPSWDELELDPVTRHQYAEQDFWTKRGDKLDQGKDKKKQKRINRAKDAYDQALAKREFAKREGTIHFDDLGVDLLIMDEAHRYKNLVSANNRFGMSPKFLGGSGESNTALDTYYKTKYLRDHNGGNGVYLMTATPTKNSPLEVYSMLSHIAPEAFERMGIKNAEEFIDRFVEFKDASILSTSGEMVDALVTAGFKNMGELREVMRRFISRRTAADVGLVIPNAENITHMVDMSPAQEAVYVELRELAKANDGDAEGEAHIFSIMDRMQKARTDLRLLGEKDANSPILDALADNAVKHATDGGQIIFCEPIAEHDHIVEALVARGVPQDQIAIVNAGTAKSSASRQQISNKFNKGEIKYVIGNKTMEQGMNLQKLTSDIHHMDIPWEPGTMQQRNGRGQRQGNKRGSIRIHTYLAKRSFDGYRHQTISSKSDWQTELWHGGDRVENLALEGGAGPAERMIMLSADPDAARAKYENDKAAAELRKAIADRTRAAESFKRLRTMEANHAKLVAEKRGETKAAAQLAVKMARVRELLTNDAAFPHKDLLTSGEEAIVEPVTGIAWRKGMGLEVPPGPSAPVEVNGERPERFVVDIVDVPNNQIWLRSLGGKRSFPVGLKATDLQAGVVPFTYSKEAEEAERQHFLITEGEEKAADARTFKEIHKLPPEIVAKHYDTFQKRLKAGVVDYSGDLSTSHYDRVPLIHNGVPKLAHSYEARKLLESHDFMLPTPEHREAALNAYVDEGAARRLETRYEQARGRSSGYGGQGKAVGMKGKYPSSDYADYHTAHPWRGPIERVFGREAREEGDRRLVDRIKSDVAAAPNMHDAFEAASKAVDVTLTDHSRGWPAPVVRALWDKAAAVGALDTPMRTAVMPPDLSAPLEHKAAGHQRLYQSDYENWIGHANSVAGGPPTVRRFLEKVAPPTLKTELAGESPASEAT